MEVDGSKFSLARRIGWVIWSLVMEFWRRLKSGFRVTRMNNTVMPVPPDTALHQLFSVPPTGRIFAGEPPVSAMGGIRD